MKRFALLPVLFTMLAATACWAQGPGAASYNAAHMAASAPAPGSNAAPAHIDATPHAAAPEAPKATAAPAANQAGSTPSAANTANANTQAIANTPTPQPASPRLHYGGGSGSYTVPVLPGNVRYSNSSRKVYNYFTSPRTKIKSLAHHTGAVHIAAPLYNPKVRHDHGFPAYYYLCSYEFIYFDILNDNVGVTKTDNTALATSMDGYVVYDKDTVAGIVTVDNGHVYVEQPENGKKELLYNSSLDDRQLRGIAMFKGNKELYFTRLAGDDKHLWRTVHSGKMNVYDNQFSFLDISNIDKTELKIACNGQTHTLRPFLTTDVKQQLVRHINKAYNLHLKAQNYTWESLLAYLDTLQ